MAPPFDSFGESTDQQERASHAATWAVIHRARGEYREALSCAEEALGARRTLGPVYPGVKLGLTEGLEAALALGNLDKVRELIALVEELRAGHVVPYHRAEAERFGARLAIVQGEHEKVEPGFKSAAGLFREIGTPFWLGMTLLEHGEWLVGQDRADDAKALLEEAREIFERLGARPWLERLDKVAGAPAESAAHS